MYTTREYQQHFSWIEFNKGYLNFLNVVFGIMIASIVQIREKIYVF
jgi:hypothetical protein